MYTIYKCKISENYREYWQFGQIKFPNLKHLKINDL